MDTLERQVMCNKQNRTRVQVLKHLQAAIREIEGYEQISLTLEPSENRDCVLITYNNYEKRADITADNEVAMILDVVKKIMY